MKTAVDLHIHTALSPCADQDMTPNNIVNMALLKGLDVIGITDHNSCDNVAAVMKAAEGKILVLPGIEVQTREDIHLLCYFESIETLKDFDCELRSHLYKLDNRPEIFGHQYIMDHRDRIIGERCELLLGAVDWSIDELVSETRKRNGVVIPAHVDRPSYSILSSLGFIPKHLHFKLLEISHSCVSIPPSVKGFRLIYSSDAHSLGDILEREMFLELSEVSVHTLICNLKSQNL